MKHIIMLPIFASLMIIILTVSEVIIGQEFTEQASLVLSISLIAFLVFVLAGVIEEIVVEVIERRKTKEKEMNKVKIIKVRIKTWEAMEEEFGLDMDDDILCDHYFTKKMEENLPKDRIIKVEERGDRYSWRCGNILPYVISKDMVEEVVGSKANKEQYAVLLRTGDTVECVSVDRLDFESQNWIKLDNIKAGDILTVIGTGVDSRGTHLLLSGKMFMHHASKFRKVEEEEKEKEKGEKGE